MTETSDRTACDWPRCDRGAIGVRDGDHLCRDHLDEWDTYLPENGNER